MAEMSFYVAAYRVIDVVKCIHKDICDEYNRRFNKRLYKSCDGKCRFFKSANDYAINTAKSINDSISDALLSGLSGHIDTKNRYNHVYFKEEYENGRI